MTLQNPSVVRDDDVYVITRLGSRELGGSETRLSPAEIEILVRLDGQSSVARIRDGARLLKADLFDAMLQRLIRSGHVDLASNVTDESLDFTEFFSERAAQPSGEMTAQAKQEASTGASSLKKDGYYVSIASRRGTKRPERGAILTVIIVEDDPGLAQFLKHYLEHEGFATRVAGNRQEIVSIFRWTPQPDLVLLDVMLPDTDGFDVLLKMRQHQRLRNVPVIMLTAKASREAVLRGLANGADGYVTKPFEADALFKAVRTVLGIPDNPFDKRNRTA